MWSKRSLFIVLTRVLLVLLTLELVYLAAANAVVRSQLIKDAVASADGFHLDYGRAYSLWPGHVRVHDVSLRVEDYNVQFELTFESAELDISLSELLAKKFHVTRLEGHAARFRARHRLITVGQDAERVAAYPSIRGFADPPYYVGVRPPPIPADQYDLWQVRIENVHAQLSELWVMEHRFRGQAVARGAFVIEPARWVQVSGASLELASGRMTLGEHVVAERVRGRISCDIPDMDVQATEGLEVLGEISTRIDVELARGQLAFLGAYLDRLGSTRFSGQAAWQLNVHVQSGVVQPGSHVTLLAQPLTLRHPLAELSGDVMLSLARRASSPERLALTLSAPHLDSRREHERVPGPTLEGVEVGLLLDAVDLTGDASRWSGQGALKRLHVPSLSWFQPGQVELSGEADASFTLTRDESGGLSGRAEVTSPQARVSRDSFSTQAAVRGKLAIERAPTARELTLSELTLSLSQVHVRAGDKHSQPFALTLDGSGSRVALHGSPTVRGTMRVHVSSAEALLPLVVSDPLREVGTSALDLQAIQARANVELGPGVLTLKQIDARSGKLRLQGHVEKRQQAETGALLLSSGPLNVGVTIAGGEADLSPFVASDWLGRPVL